MRDNFKARTKLRLAQRVNYLCSNPDCRSQTLGPASTEDGVVTLGIAAHIAAAAPGGPRFDENMAPLERASIRNAIWLCNKCARLIDLDAERFDIRTLHLWKDQAEHEARFALFRTVTKQASKASPFSIVRATESHLWRDGFYGSIFPIDHFAKFQYSPDSATPEDSGGLKLDVTILNPDRTPWVIDSFAVTFLGASNYMIPMGGFFPTPIKVTARYEMDLGPISSNISEILRRYENHELSSLERESYTIRGDSYLKKNWLPGAPLVLFRLMGDLGTVRYRLSDPLLLKGLRPFRFELLLQNFPQYSESCFRLEIRAGNVSHYSGSICARFLQ